MTQPKPKHIGDKWIPIDDSKTMNWCDLPILLLSPISHTVSHFPNLMQGVLIQARFRNIPAGETFSANDKSGDYSLQLMIGYHNYQAWLNTQRSFVSSLFHRTNYVFPGTGTMPGSAEKTDGLRSGPQMSYETSESEE